MAVGMIVVYLYTAVASTGGQLIIYQASNEFKETECARLYDIIH